MPGTTDDIPRRLLVIAAHAGDFVWRSGGAIATAVAAGGEARVVALSYGERGESGELWKVAGQTVEAVKEVRHAEATSAAGILGASFDCLDLGDYPLRFGEEVVDRLRDVVLDFAPHVLLTHTERDPFNPDHPVAHAAVVRARLLATGAGVAGAFPTVPPSALFFFEPHQPERCGFLPDTFLDITPVVDRKIAAMAAFASQSYMGTHYAQRAEHRAWHARYANGDASVRHAEAFQRAVPAVVRQL
ncbi:PIG-L family deacetylase [Geodermatophilus sp. YIM 151500]|uniref:PIG-L deacetylase family protein n=1 Tax=Geodermatophilus sp. YIM 151500 TaxID=2984531 RepID=UPI0021E48A8A|nr:PIG-L deacetylase family protein [Geodermatophilus sp. YIM 151500]MCV2489884.1 PIG-L family deacetylase [Geodermatophilus sp. YIM 151500]